MVFSGLFHCLIAGQLGRSYTLADITLNISVQYQAAHSCTALDAPTTHQQNAHASLISM